MIKWLKRLLIGCDGCKFKEVRCVSVFNQYSKDIPDSFVYVMRCETCGRMKNHKV
ncbi:hypothetical protein ABIE91_009586 [Bradyrhizobium elkanii]